MKRLFEKINKNAVWIFILAVFPIREIGQSVVLFPFTHNTARINTALAHTDWILFAAVLMFTFVLFSALRRLNKAQERITALEKQDERKEAIYLDMYIRFLRLNFRVECAMGHNRTTWEPQKEKEFVAGYVKEYDSKRSLEDFDKLMQKHFPELPIIADMSFTGN